MLEEVQAMNPSIQIIKQSLNSPEAASSWIGFFVIWDMKPTMENITMPANMLVQEFIQHTIIASLSSSSSSLLSFTHKQHLSVMKFFVLNVSST